MGVWTDQGFVAQTKEYYKELIIPVFKEAFGEDFATDETLPQGILIDRLAELFYGMDMDGVEAFARLNLNTMGGLFLDTIGNFRGIPRVLGKPQSAMIEISFNVNSFVPFTIPQGTILTVTETGESFVTNTINTFETSSTVTITADYTENGNSLAVVNNTMTIENYPQVTNLKIVGLFDGTENESDISYRNRLLKDYPAATNTIEFILNKMRAVVGVRSVGVLYNDSSDPVGDLPPYSTEFLFAPTTEDAGSLGIIQNEIAQIILNNKVPGSPTVGTIVVSTTDVFGQPKTVSFTKATPVVVHIYVQVTTPEATGMLDLSNKDSITETIKTYVNSLDISKDVSYSRCMAPLSADTGFDVADFAIRKEGVATWYDKENLSIGDKQYAVFGSITFSGDPKPEL